MKDKTTTGTWLSLATDKLRTVGIDSARLDALILLEDATKFDRALILAHPEIILSDRTCETLMIQLNRRANHEPLAYIRGNIEFYGRNFIVNKDVLIPRPESEAFIELLAGIKPKKGQVLLDIGTGCGNLAITAKLEYPVLNVLAIDISNDALKTARYNAKALGAKIKFIKADLTVYQMPRIDIILANLPYLPKNCQVSPAVHFEPTQALYAPENGLQFINYLAPLAYKSLNANGFVLIESLPEQLSIIKLIYQKHGFKNITASGLVQCFQKLP